MEIVYIIPLSLCFFILCRLFIYKKEMRAEDANKALIVIVCAIFFALLLIDKLNQP